MTDEALMRRAIELAKGGIGFVNPNPLVGAVVVREGRIIGEGFHERYGQPHAERDALSACTEDPRGAEMYVTLEPCCHTGKQPPCTEAIIEAGITKITVGSDDPNPIVAGKGYAQLEKAGIQVIRGFLKEECDALNRIFFHYITKKTPYVIMKVAMTADGKTATRMGYSRWITGETSRRHVHETRKRCAAVMVGIGTVLADDPSLNCRIENPSQPVRIICDSNLQLPLECTLVKTARDVPVWDACCHVDRRRAAVLEERGVRILEVPEREGNVDLAALMKILGAEGIDSLLIEGGAAINEAALRARIIQHVQIYIAPKIFGGVSAKTAVGGLGVDQVEEAYKLTRPEITRCGEDVLLEFEVEGV